MMNQEAIKQAIEQIAAGQANLLDVRRDEERAETGAAKGAINFPIEKMMAGELPDLNKEQPTYIFCRSGGRAGHTQMFLQQNGFKDVHNLGGFKDWQAAGGPVSRP